jgi:hypothetical protein
MSDLVIVVSNIFGARCDVIISHDPHGQSDKSANPLIGVASSSHATLKLRFD